MSESDRTGSGARDSRPDGWTLGPDAPKGACAVCHKVLRPSVRCWSQGRDDVRGRVVCKQCCIAALDGHRCVWWDLCWNI
ncbi:MAG: hypothetical protein R6V58_07755 [Planctomycetota bacterium]